jgi:hypothetical protein
VRNTRRPFSGSRFARFSSKFSAFELLESLSFVRRQTWTLARIALRLSHLAPQRLRAAPELFIDGSNRRPLRRVRLQRLEHRPDRTFTQLGGILTRSSYGPHPLSEWALRQTRYGSMLVAMMTVSLSPCAGVMSGTCIRMAPMISPPDPAPDGFSMPIRTLSLSEFPGQPAKLAAGGANARAALVLMASGPARALRGGWLFPWR